MEKDKKFQKELKNFDSELDSNRDGGKLWDDSCKTIDVEEQMTLALGWDGELSSTYVKHYILQPDGKIVCVMTRWSTKDLTGQMIKAQGEEGSDEWEVIITDGKQALEKALSLVRDDPKLFP